MPSNAWVAQWIERLPPEQKVVGSNPALRTISLPHWDRIRRHPQKGSVFVKHRGCRNSCRDASRMSPRSTVSIVSIAPRMFQVGRAIYQS